MLKSRIAAVQLGLLLLAMSASAEVKNSNIRITVLDSETRPVGLGDNSGVPKNCDGVNFDAYCLNSKTSEVTNTMLVQEANKPPFRIACNIDTKWSRCIPLQKGESFNAQREKRGLLVYYVDDKGKVRKQLYALLTPEASSEGPTAATTAAPASAPSSDAAGAGTQATTPAAVTSQSVRCSFNSTPPGAEVTVDGRYVGSTPSVLNLSIGNHTVAVSLPGFAQWKRDLGVSSGSELTVNAVLEKAQ